MTVTSVSRKLNCTAGNYICIFTHIICQLMSLGTGANRGWWGPCTNTRHSREVLWQPCEREPALQEATNQHRHTEATSVEKLTWHNTYHEPLPMRGGKGWVLNWQKKVKKAVIHKLNGASKLQIWPKQWSVQGSDPQRSAQKTTKIVATGSHMQAHGEESSCGHPTDHRDHRTHWLKINLA